MLYGVSPVVQVPDSVFSFWESQGSHTAVTSLGQEKGRDAHGPPATAPFFQTLGPCVPLCPVCGYATKSSLCRGATVLALCCVQVQENLLHVSLREKTTVQIFFWWPSLKQFECFTQHVYHCLVIHGRCWFLIGDCLRHPPLYGRICWETASCALARLCNVVVLLIHSLFKARQGISAIHRGEWSQNLLHPWG